MRDRDPVNELYDRGFDLVEAATAMRRAATAADVAHAAPAVLGCPVVVPTPGEYVADGAARQADHALVRTRAARARIR